MEWIWLLFGAIVFGSIAALIAPRKGFNPAAAFFAGALLAIITIPYLLMQPDAERLPPETVDTAPRASPLGGSWPAAGAGAREMTGPVAVRTYHGATKADAAQTFAADASVAGAEGYEPVNQEWDEATLIVTYKSKGASFPAHQATVDLAPVAVLIGGAMVAAGSVLPWISATSGFVTVTRSGVEGGDGLLTIVIGIGLALLGLAIAVEPARSESLLGLLALVAIAALIAAGYEWYTISDRITDPSFTSASVFASIGIGIWIMLIGALVAVVGWLNLRQRAPALSAITP